MEKIEVNYKNKKFLFKICLVVLVSLIAVFALVPINKNYDSVAWMKDVKDEVKITELSIPGTHDSGAMHSFLDVSGKCQDLNILNQLNIGVRFLDIRLQLVNDKLNVVHSFVDQGLTFDNVLKDLNSFLNNNESEFIIMSLKEDADSKNSSVDFDDTLISVLKENKRIKLENLPETLGEARGNIYILNRFTDEELGIQAYSGWLDSTSFELGNLYVQDNYCIKDVNIKIEDIKRTIEFSNNKDKLVLNFTSCYLDDAFPPTYAATACKTINDWLLENINNDNHLGIMIIDFATKELVESIYKRNLK